MEKHSSPRQSMAGRVADTRQEHIYHNIFPVTSVVLSSVADRIVHNYSAEKVLDANWIPAHTK